MRGARTTSQLPAEVLASGVGRVAVIGCGGSGKTVFAKEFGRALGLPTVHLDAHHYGDDWQPYPPERFATSQREMVAADRWVIDGNYSGTLPIRLARADLVVFLDLPAVTCLWGIIRRRWRYRGGQHPGAGVYDRITLSFIRYIVGYRRTMRPRVLSLVREHAAPSRLVTVRSRHETRVLLRQLSRACASGPVQP